MNRWKNYAVEKSETLTKFRQLCRAESINDKITSNFRANAESLYVTSFDIRPAKDEERN